MLAAVLTAVILLGYAGSLWWLLRRESATVLLGLLALCAVSLSLRLVYTTEYPPGLNEDEPKILWCSIRALREGRLTVECAGAPVLLNALFQAQLVPLVGPTRWAIRTYAIITSVLASPAAYAVGRGLGLTVAGSLTAGALIAVLPWSIFYGRMAEGGELLFHQMLVLAALARIVFLAGAWMEVGIAAFALCLLLYDYFCGRAMLAMPLVAALLTRGRRRLLCLLIPVVAFAGFWPHYRTATIRWGLSFEGFDERYAQDLIGTLGIKMAQALAAFVWPVASDGWRTIRTAAMHPPLLLALAISGSLLLGVRAGLYLWLGFLLGLAPVVVSWGDAPSTHRMLMAFPFVAVAAAGALDAIPQRRLLRGVVMVVVVATVSFQSVRLFFSSEFWPPLSRSKFDWERTALVEALPPSPHPRFILFHHIGYFWSPRSQVDDNSELLHAENWFPQNGTPAIYVFTAQAARLRPFYENLLGYERVQPVGRGFIVHVEARDWTWLREHGWTYEIECKGGVRRARVPALFFAGVTFKGVYCAPPIVHRWGARWEGPAQSLRLRYSGHALVRTGAGGRLVDKDGWESFADFEVKPGDDVYVTVTTRKSIAVDVQLVETTPATERVPAWERWRPIPVNDLGS